MSWRASCAARGVSAPPRGAVLTRRGRGAGRTIQTNSKHLYSFLGPSIDSRGAVLTRFGRGRQGPEAQVTVAGDTAKAVAQWVAQAPPPNRTILFI